MNQLLVFTLTSLLLAVASVVAQDGIGSNNSDREEQFLRLVRQKACEGGRCDDNRIEGTGGESSSSHEVGSLDSMSKESSDSIPIRDEIGTKREFPVRNKRKCLSWTCRRSQVDTVRSAKRQDGNTEEDNGMVAGKRKRCTFSNCGRRNIPRLRAATSKRTKETKKKRCIAWACTGRSLSARGASTVNPDESGKMKRINKLAEKIAPGILTAKRERKRCMSWTCSGKRSMAKKNDAGTGILSHEQDKNLDLLATAHGDKCRSWDCRLKRIVARQNVPGVQDAPLPSNCLSWDCGKRKADSSLQVRGDIVGKPSTASEEIKEQEQDENDPHGMTDTARDTVPDIRRFFSDSSRTRNSQTQD